MRFAFLGGGKMARAIARGMIEHVGIAVDDVLACDISAEAREAFTAATGITCLPPEAPWLEGADVLFLAVKPQVAEHAIRTLPARPAGMLYISIMAGFGLPALQRLLGSGRVIRVMPNTPLMVGKGASAYAPGPDVVPADLDLVQRILGALGVATQVEEDQLDAVTALSGSGPAYVFEFIQAMAEAGAEVGLPADLAMTLTLQTVVGAAEMLQQGLGTPEQLRRAVTSPGGTTAAGLAVLEQADFRGLVRRVVTAARDRSVELGKLA